VASDTAAADIDLVDTADIGPAVKGTAFAVLDTAPAEGDIAAALDIDPVPVADTALALWG
jgi:hypothetical protein